MFGLRRHCCLSLLRSIVFTCSCTACSQINQLNSLITLLVGDLTRQERHVHVLMCCVFSDKPAELADHAAGG